VLLLGLVPGVGFAVDVEPRLYSNVPVGANFVQVAYARSSGEVSFDSSVPVSDVDGEIDQVVVSYSRGLDVFGRSGLLTVALPYAAAGLEGLYLGEPASGRREGFGDPQLRLSVNLWGAEALRPEAFRSYRQKTIVGVTLTVAPPLGSYQPERVINAGTNRWKIVGQVGASHRRGPWTLESAVGVSWSSDNDEVRGTNRLEQEPIALYRGTVLYNFTPSLWIGAGVAYAYGGATELNGVDRNDHLSNWRVGLALSFAPARRHRIQLRATDGMVARIGQDFRTYGFAYTYSF
jgi:hypothetical protein